ncbi:hypothetical protein DBR06_SOUSAS7310027, partial [Sousa chinensis]
CLDLSEEMLSILEGFNGSKANTLCVSQKMISMFMRTKHRMSSKRHELVLVVL